jgi:photosystem II stability/assembly factor-like uncharacterized protein
MKKYFIIALVTVVGGTLLKMSSTVNLAQFEWLKNEKEGETEEKEKETGADRQMMSWFWSRAYPDPTDLNHKFYSGWLQAQAMRHPVELLDGANGTSGANGIDYFNGNWIAIGPSQNIGGRILSIAIDPTNGNRIFVGSASGGIWRTITGGVGSNAWRQVATNYPVLGVAALIIHPGNPNIIYAGTGEVYRTANSNIGYNVWKARGTYGVGILKSTDGGVSWAQVFGKNMSDLFAVNRLKFDPIDANIVYASTTDGLYRTLNAGINWTKILNKTYVSDFAINPTNNTQMVAAVGNLLDTDKGIYRSTDGGATWVKITAGLPATYEGFIHFDNVAISPNMLMASIGRDAGTTSNELYRSNDFGATWTELNNSNHCEYQFWYSHDVAINPSNANSFVFGGVNLYNYNASSGNRTSVGGVHSDIHDIAFDPSNSNIVYVACDGGMYRSTNGGASFSMVNSGLQAVQFYAPFGVCPGNPNIMVGGLQDNGVVRYNGTTWSSVAGGDGGPTVFHPTNPNIVFSSNDARHVMKSTNGGTSFSEVLTSWAFAADSRTAFMAPLAISKSNPNVVYSGTDNLHKSSSGGGSGSWNGNNYNSATTYIEAQHKTAIAIAVSPVNENKLYISTSPFAQYDNDVNNLYVNTPPNLFKSTNGGTSWTNIKGSLPDRFVMDFEISPTSDDSVWIVLGGFGTSHVYVTGNGGVTWTAKGNGLPDVPTNAIALDPLDPSTVYVGNDLGVYVSPDRGNTWFDFNNGLWDATQVMDLIVAKNRKLVAATHGKGVFISDLYTASLPVTLVNFSGTNHGNINTLQWATSVEDNFDHFELERSYGGGNFTSIVTIQSKNSPSGSNYSYDDNISSIKDAETIFYRLRIVNKDGSVEYSNVVSIRMPLKTNFIVKGNPFSDVIKMQLTTTNRENVQMNLYDATGKLIARKLVVVSAGTNQVEWNNLQTLASGNYVLSIQTSAERFSQKLLKR